MSYKELKTISTQNEMLFNFYADDGAKLHKAIQKFLYGNWQERLEAHKEIKQIQKAIGEKDPRNMLKIMENIIG